MLNTGKCAKSFFTLSVFPYSSFTSKYRLSAVNKDSRNKTQALRKKKSQTLPFQTKGKNIPSGTIETKRKSEPFQEFDSFPKRFWRARSNFDIPYCFALKKDIADVIAKIVIKSINPSDTTVIELNPGMGLITRSLLERGVKHLTVYDMLNCRPFKELIKEYESRITKCPHNVLDVEGTDNVYVKELEKFKDRHASVIGINPSRVFLRRILQTIILHEWSFCQNVEFFFAISEQVYDCITASHSHQSKTYDYGAFHLLMDMHVLCELPRSAFLPASNKNEKSMLFARVRRKKVTALPTNECVHFWNFLQLIGSSKYNFVIGALEKWFPGSGPHFISKGLATTTQTSELSARELVVLFNMLKDLEGYDDVLELLRDKTFEFDDGVKTDGMDSEGSGGGSASRSV